jgi:hypothetical protein
VRRYRTPYGCRCTRTSLGALLPSIRGDRSKGAKARARKTRRGNEEVCVVSNRCTRGARPHPEERAFRRHSANSNARARVSKDEDEPPIAPSCFETHRSALSAGEAIALGTRCDAPQHEGDQDQPAAVRNVRLCFRPVIYRENCNRNVSAALSPKIPITAMWSNGTMRRAAPWFRLGGALEAPMMAHDIVMGCAKPARPPSTR